MSTLSRCLSTTRKNRSEIEPLLRRLNVDLDVWTGADLDTLGKFGLGNIVPGAVVIDDKGQITSRVMDEAHDEDVRTPVDWLLSGRTGTAPAAASQAVVSLPEIPETDEFLSVSNRLCGA